MATMKAARWHAAKDVRIEEVEVPEVQPHQVKSGSQVHRNLWVQICMNIWWTNLHSNRRTCVFWSKAPVTLGHEFSGEIVEVK